MSSFKYTAYNAQGAKFSGEIDADSKDLALAELQKRQLMVSQISQKIEYQGFEIGNSSKKVGLKELEFLTSELSLLLKNGVKIDRGLSILNKNSANRSSGKLIDDLLKGVRRGETLSQAMAEHAGVFSSLYLSLVKLGEASGNLPMVFERLSVDLRFQRELKDKIIQALTYPMIIFMVCVLCILFVFNYIVPQMSGLFSGIDELPYYTQILLDVSAWVQAYQWWVLVGLLGLGAGIKILSQQASWQQRFANWLIKLPLISQLLILTEQIRFNSALSMMSEAGVSIDKAMLLAADSVNNVQLRQELLIAQQDIRKGSPLSVAVGQCVLYPDFSISLLEVGEESGDLGPVFTELSHRSKMQFESSVNKLTSVLEPLLILVMGGIVGSVVVTMLLSIVSVNDIGF